MDGDGYADLVVQGGRRVYTAAPRTGGWGGTYRVAEGPSVDLDAPNLKLADLTGNGLPDALRSGVSGWMFFENLGHGRWGPRSASSRAAGTARRSARPSCRYRWRRPGRSGVRRRQRRHRLAVVEPRTVRRAVPHAGRTAFRRRFQAAKRALHRSDRLGTADLLYVRDGVVQVAFNQAGVKLSALIEVARSALTSQGFVEVADVLGTAPMGCCIRIKAGRGDFASCSPRDRSICCHRSTTGSEARPRLPTAHQRRIGRGISPLVGRGAPACPTPRRSSIA